MPDLTPNDVKENEFVYYKDPITNQELKFLVIDVASELFSNGFTCRLMLLDEPKHAIKTCNNTGSASFSVPRQTRQVADNAYTFRDEFGEWPSSDVILLSRCYTKQYGEVIEAIKAAREKLAGSAAVEAATEDLRALDGYELYHGVNKFSPAESTKSAESEKPFMSADRAKELAENSLNIKERVALRIEDAAKSGEFETYLTQEEFKICELDLVEQGYVVLNNKIFWDE